MTRRQAVLAEMIAAREEARLGSDTLSLEGRQRLYDLEAALDALENRLLAGREIVTDAVLHRGSELARSLLELMRQRFDDLAEATGHDSTVKAQAPQRS